MRVILCFITPRQVSFPCAIATRRRQVRRLRDVPCGMLTFHRSICVAIASSSKSLRSKLQDAVVEFSTPLRIADNTAPDEHFPELTNFDNVARGHNIDGGPGSALLVKGIVAVRALRDVCCSHARGGELATLRACSPFVGGTLRRAETVFHSGKVPLSFVLQPPVFHVSAAGAESFSVEIRDDVLMPQQMNWLVQAVLAKAPVFTLKAATIPTTQRFCSLLHKGGIESGAASICAVRWDTARKVYRVVQDNL